MISTLVVIFKMIPIIDKILAGLFAAYKMESAAYEKRKVQSTVTAAEKGSTADLNKLIEKS